MSNPNKAKLQRSDISLNKIPTIWDNNNFFNYSDPQPGWLFSIKFLSDVAGANELKDLLPINIGLPTFETTTVEKSYMGTTKTFPINRKYAGDTEMTFYIRVNDNDNEDIATLTKMWEITPGIHNELDRTYNKVVVTLYDKKGSSASAKNVMNSYKKIYTYYNVILTSLNLGEVSYENETMVQCTIGIHYDYWTKDFEAYEIDFDLNSPLVSFGGDSSLEDGNVTVGNLELEDLD